MIVADASTVVAALTDLGPAGGLTRSRMRGQRILVPFGFDLEVLSALRGLDLGGRLSPHQGRRAVADLVRLRLERRTTSPLAPRIWELSANLTAYDAAYVALAELLGCPLVTLDRRLGRATGIRCGVEVLA